MKFIRPILVLIIVAFSQAMGDQSPAINPLVDVYILCNTQKYANGSAFSEGLSTVLTALKKEAASTSYHTSKSGNVLGAYQCRGDLAQATCSECVSQAAQSALDSCPYAIGSRVQLDGCFLRYENYSFLREDSSVVEELCNTHKFNSSSTQSHITRLLSQVTTAAPKSNRLYASATSSIPDATSDVASSTSTRLYALAQCLNYLSSSQCADCLAAHKSSWQDCQNAVGAQIHSVSCYYRFEIYPFFYQ